MPDQVVEFVESTDNGFVYVTEKDHRRLYFTNGRYAADRIGLVAPGHVGDFPVLTGNPGSLVAWQTLTTSPYGEVVVYDSHRHEIVASRVADWSRSGASICRVYERASCNCA